MTTTNTNARPAFADSFKRAMTNYAKFYGAAALAQPAAGRRSCERIAHQWPGCRLI
jgi:hypothetical protein